MSDSEDENFEYLKKWWIDNHAVYGKTVDDDCFVLVRKFYLDYKEFLKILDGD